MSRRVLTVRPARAPIGRPAEPGYAYRLALSDMGRALADVRDTLDQLADPTPRATLRRVLAALLDDLA